MYRKTVEKKKDVKVTKVVKMPLMVITEEGGNAISLEEADKGPWTQFWDMHSGGGAKEAWEKIYIQAPEDEACTIFYNRFNHSPHRVSCTCCGSDYSVSESKTLREATAFHRQCGTKKNKAGKEVWAEVDDHSFVKYGGQVRKHMPFEEFISQYPRQFPKGDHGRCLLIFKTMIKPEEREGDVPEQGYVWQD